MVTMTAIQRSASDVHGDILMDQMQATSTSGGLKIVSPDSIGWSNHVCRHVNEDTNDVLYTM